MSDNLLTPERFPGAKFATGRLVHTPGAGAIGAARMLECLYRHIRGDWGCKYPEDKQENDRALRDGDGRLFWTFPIDPTKPYGTHEGNMVWVITEWDRSVTTFLLPDEY